MKSKFVVSLFLAAALSMPVPAMAFPFGKQIAKVGHALKKGGEYTIVGTLVVLYIYAKAQ